MRVYHPPDTIRFLGTQVAEITYSLDGVSYRLWIRVLPIDATPSKVIYFLHGRQIDITHQHRLAYSLTPDTLGVSSITVWDNQNVSRIVREDKPIAKLE
jgi:hypothetical protein